VRQNELFPVLIDQELIDDYLYFQKSLKTVLRHKLSYENTIKNCNRAIEESFIESWDDEIQRKRTLKEFTNFINDIKNRVSECQTTIEICLETITEYSEHLTLNEL
tara:strand:+ start:37 stop:354 length:318 start_codon:yes stop_codon:yes gene_type:complete